MVNTELSGHFREMDSSFFLLLFKVVQGLTVPLYCYKPFKSSFFHFHFIYSILEVHTDCCVTLFLLAGMFLYVRDSHTVRYMVATPTSNTRLPLLSGFSFATLPYIFLQRPLFKGELRYSPSNKYPCDVISATLGAHNFCVGHIGPATQPTDLNTVLHQDQRRSW